MSSVLKYLHHMMFDPTSAAEQFGFGVAMLPIVFVGLCLVRVILYWIYGDEDDV